MHNHLKHSSYFGIMIFLLTTYCCQVDAGEMESIQAAWKKREHSTRKIKFTWNQKYVMQKGMMSTMWELVGRGRHQNPTNEMIPPQDEILTYSSFLSLDGTQLRYESVIPVWNSKSKKVELHRRLVTVNSSKLSKSLYPDTNDVTTRPRGSITPARNGLDPQQHQVSPMLCACRGLVESLQPYDISKYTLAENREVIEGVSCVLLSRQDRSSRSTQKMWLDPARDYAMIRYSLENVRFTRFRIDVRHQRHPEAGWLPSEWDVVVRLNDKGMMESYRCVVESVEVDPVLPSSHFDLTFPRDAIVYDETKQKWAQRPDKLLSGTNSWFLLHYLSLLLAGLNCLLLIVLGWKWRKRVVSKRVL